MSEEIEYSSIVSLGSGTPTTEFSFPTFGGQQEETTPGFWGTLTNNPLLGKIDKVLDAYIDVEKYKAVKKTDAKYTTVQSTQTPQNADSSGQQASTVAGKGTFIIPTDMIILAVMGFAIFKIASE